MERILRLDLTGTPKAWLSREQAAMAYSKQLVRWELGNTMRVMVGGINKSGKRSSIRMAALIACDGRIVINDKCTQSFSNKMLFKRDNHQCMYCAALLPYAGLTRDHIFPSSRGGKDIWENVVAACKPCNQHKADRTPEEAGMTLLAIPFRPNIFEAMYLSGHKILADQMDYLGKRFSGNRTW